MVGSVRRLWGEMIWRAWYYTAQLPLKTAFTFPAAWHHSDHWIQLYTVQYHLVSLLLYLDRINVFLQDILDFISYHLVGDLLSCHSPSIMEHFESFSILERDVCPLQAVVMSQHFEDKVMNISSRFTSFTDQSVVNQQIQCSA